jgi:hypothetical protein
MIKDFSQEQKILQEALYAAAEATRTMIAANPDHWYPCGFSWVTISPARGKLVAAMKHFKIGHKADSGGWMVYNPSGHLTQWMDAKMAGSRAYAAVLRKYYPELTIRAIERVD